MNYIKNEIVFKPFKPSILSSYIKIENRMVKVPKSQRDKLQEEIDLILTTAKLLDYFIIANFYRTIVEIKLVSKESVFRLELEVKDSKFNKALKEIRLTRDCSKYNGVRVRELWVQSDETKNFIETLQKIRTLL